MNIEIAKNIYWVGVTDWGIRRFHGFELSVHRGSTYNSYLIMDEKIAIVDAVWAPHADEFMAKIKAIVDPAKIDYVIVNHAEPDHSSSLPILMKYCPNATVWFPKTEPAAWKVIIMKSGTSRLSRPAIG